MHAFKRVIFGFRACNVMNVECSSMPFLPLLPNSSLDFHIGVQGWGIGKRITPSKQLPVCFVCLFVCSFVSLFVCLFVCYVCFFCLFDGSS